VTKLEIANEHENLLNSTTRDAWSQWNEGNSRQGIQQRRTEPQPEQSQFAAVVAQQEQRILVQQAQVKDKFASGTEEFLQIELGEGSAS